MKVTVQKWGNSIGIRIPFKLAEQMNNQKRNLKATVMNAEKIARLSIAKATIYQFESH